MVLGFLNFSGLGTIGFGPWIPDSDHFFIAVEPTSSLPQKRRRTEAMELMEAAMKRFASMDSDELESENSKLKAEIAMKTEEIVQLRQKGQRTELWVINYES